MPYIIGKHFFGYASRINGSVHELLARLQDVAVEVDNTTPVGLWEMYSRLLKVKQEQPRHVFVDCRHLKLVADVGDSFQSRVQLSVCVQSIKRLTILFAVLGVTVIRFRETCRSVYNYIKF